MEELLKIASQAGPIGIAGVIAYFYKQSQTTWSAREASLLSEIEDQKQERREAQVVINQFLGDIPMLTKSIEEVSRELDRGEANGE